jgi:hypothetical protein
MYTCLGPFLPSLIGLTVRFIVWFLARIFKAQTQRRKILPKTGSGPWLVSEGDSELKKSMLPFISQEPVRIHLPSVVAPESLSLLCVVKNKCWPVLSMSKLTSGINKYSKEHSGRVSEMTPLYVHHLQNQCSPFPTHNKTIISEEPKVSRTHQVASKTHLIPNVHPP